MRSSNVLRVCSEYSTAPDHNAKVDNGIREEMRSKIRTCRSKGTASATGESLPSGTSSRGLSSSGAWSSGISWRGTSSNGVTLRRRREYRSLNNTISTFSIQETNSVQWTRPPIKSRLNQCGCSPSSLCNQRPNYFILWGNWSVELLKMNTDIRWLKKRPLEILLDRIRYNFNEVHSIPRMLQFAHTDPRFLTPLVELTRAELHLVTLLLRPR